MCAPGFPHWTGPWPPTTTDAPAAGAAPEPTTGDPRVNRSIRGLGQFLGDAWRLARPYFRSEERWSARLLLAAIVALNLFMVAIDVILSFWNRAFYNALQDKDWNSFIDLLLTWHRGDDGLMPGFCGIATLYIIVVVYRTYLNQWLQIRWRRWLTSDFLDRWLADRAYYRISLTSSAAATADGASDDAARVGTDNPDQRISDDMRGFVADALSLSLDLLSNVVSLFSFVTILWSLSGPIAVYGVSVPGYMVWVALLYAAVGTGLTHLIGRPLAALNFRQQRVEADFRFSLVRLRENVEGVALYGGEAEEQRGLLGRFSSVMSNWWAIMQRTKLLNALIAGYSQIAVVFPIIVASPRYFAGTIALGGMMQTVNAFGQVQGAMSWFVNSYASIASWRATVERLATFDRAIEAARAADARGVQSGAATGDAFALEDLSLLLPNGQTLLAPTSIVLPRGRSVVVSGRSGSGKSTLFRALAGIWPFGSGRVLRPSGHVLFLPQRPYIPLGTLRHAVCYPADTAAHGDQAVTAALSAVGLDGLVGRLDAAENWAQLLSGGEQQRLAIARALLARPDWLFMDEATASLDPQSERDVYAAIRRVLPDTTLVSISHRPAVDALHDRRLMFERSGGQPGRLVDAQADAAVAD